MALTTQSVNIEGNTPPTAFDINFGGNVTLGTDWSSSLDGWVVGARYYKSAFDVVGHTCSIWSSSGDLLVRAISNISQSNTGWQTMSFATPYPITASNKYRVSHWVYTYGNNINGESANTVSASTIFSPNPLVKFASGYYIYSTTDAFPTNLFSYYMKDVTFQFVADTAFTWSRNTGLGQQSVAGWAQGINVGGPTSINSDSPFEKPYQIGVTRSYSEGSPATPCLEIDYPGMWRFRWAVKSGTRTISVKAKQVSNVTGKRPKLVVKSRPSIGIMNDVSASAGSSTDWVTIGPATVTPTGNGGTWVELWNMDTDTFSSPAFFDHIVTT